MMQEDQDKLYLAPELFLTEFENDLLDYNKCKSLIDKLEEEKNLLVETIAVDNDTSNVSKTVKVVCTTVVDIDCTVTTAQNVVKKVEDDLDEIDDCRKKLQEQLDAMYTTETRIQYTQVVCQILKLNYELQKEYVYGDDEKCATLFANLCEISRTLYDSKAENLREYFKYILTYWHEALKENYANIFNEHLKGIKWPFVNTNFSLMTPAQGHITKLQIITEYLLQIEMPEEHQSPHMATGLLADFPPLCLPIQYLLQPLQKRFAYHFYGGRQTNRIDKPEWYFTQILSWIRDHIDFVTRWIQPVIDKLGLHHIDAKLELMRGLVQLAVEKLHSELPNLRYDDFTFSHSIDEALGFDKELRETYFYPVNQPSIVNVLTQGSIFNQWIKMERKYALEKMDAMLNDHTSAFDLLAAEEEEFKITICADTFITLLQTISERYESLPQPGHRLQFLDLQNELLDNFRIRLLQLVNSATEFKDLMDSQIAAIANTIFYIENVLLDWGTMIHYLNLYYYKNQLESMEMNEMGVSTENAPHFSPGYEIETETVFAETLRLFRHMRRDLLCTLAEAVVHEAKLKSYDYVRERWSTMLYHKDLREFSLTPSACPMFEVLAKRLHQLQKSLAVKLFTIVWRFIAHELDNYLFGELVLDNRFNDGGAMQLKYDLHRNLFPLFSQFSEKPENYFAQLKESCDLLNITKGSALLLRETLLALEGATGVEDKRGVALKEIGVTHLTPKMSLKILNHRTDITINRMSSID